MTAARRFLALSSVLVAAAFTLSGCRIEIPAELIPPPAAAPAPGSPTRANLEQLIHTVSVVPARNRLPGYSRGCKQGQGCVFGPAWSDDNDARLGHDGCDTRNNVLAAQLTSVAYRNGSRPCVVVSGSLADPYSGKTVAFSKRDGGEIQIDHVYPLAAAWDMGADVWPLEERMRFANDVDFNLLAVNGSANQSKGDDTPSDWLPPAAAYRCFYAGKYLSVAAQYRR